MTGRRTLTEHWNGKEWSIVPSPNSSFPNVSATRLYGVDAMSTNDVWAVGYGEDFSSLKSETLIIHWNGKSWSIVPSPNPGGSEYTNTLNAIDGVAPNDIWSVGAQGYPEKSLTLHWNGSSWQTIPNACRTPLTGVVAITSRD